MTPSPDRKNLLTGALVFAASLAFAVLAFFRGWMAADPDPNCVSYGVPWLC